MLVLLLYREEKANDDELSANRNSNRNAVNEPSIIQVNVINIVENDAIAAAALAREQENGAENEQVAVRPYIYDGSCSQFLHYHALKFFSLLCKPHIVMNVHSVVYSIHMFLAVFILIYAWRDKCQSNLHSLVSLFFARAAIGWRITYWQTHSTTLQPNCAEIFFKVNHFVICITTCTSFLLFLSLFCLPRYIYVPF